MELCTIFLQIRSSTFPLCLLQLTYMKLTWCLLTIGYSFNRYITPKINIFEQNFDANLRFNICWNVHIFYTTSVHEITAGHRSLSGTISCVTYRIRFLLDTMTGRFSNFNSTSCTEDEYDLWVTGAKCRLPDMMSGTGEIFISGAEPLI